MRPQTLAGIMAGAALIASALVMPAAAQGGEARTCDDLRTARRDAQADMDAFVFENEYKATAFKLCADEWHPDKDDYLWCSYAVCQANENTDNCMDVRHAYWSLYDRLKSIAQQYKAQGCTS